MRRLLYEPVRIVALAVNAVTLVVAAVEMRDTVARSIVHPLLFLSTVVRYPSEAVYVLTFWAPLLAVLALFMAKGK